MHDGNGLEKKKLHDGKILISCTLAMDELYLKKLIKLKNYFLYL